MSATGTPEERAFRRERDAMEAWKTSRPTPMPVSLTGFLLARIAEDEADADGIDRYRIYDDERWNVARVLAECEAKRRIVEAYTEPQRSAWFGDDDYFEGLEVALKALALPYADHPDYRDEWRP